VPHVFVETNWIFAYAAPAHHQVPAAVELLERASRGEFVIQIPNPCIDEARQAIRTKCQPRREAEAIRRFLSWAESVRRVRNDEATNTRTVLDKFESSIQHDLAGLDDALRNLATLPYVNIFGLDDTMLERATTLALDGIAPKPFDHAILAAVLVASERLWEQGERGLSFCEADSDLQPWDKDGNIKRSLTTVYDQAHLWVYGDFTLTQPPRREGFE
jgi:predicted nucleic acid-binding protein